MPVNVDVSFYLRSLGCSLLLLVLAAAAPYSVAADLASEQKADEQKNTVPGYLVRIEHNDPAEIEAALLRAEAFYLESGMRSDSPRITRP